jgi:glycerol-3-phosphate acyltransferase PlsY
VIDPATTLLLVIFAYLLGSIPSGFILGRAAGIDVRHEGSGNIGATNVARVLGKRHGLLTLLADTAKGIVPILIGQHLGLSNASLALVAIAVFVGHIYPVFLKFRGGKGVATAFGALLGLAPWATLAMIFVFGAAVLVSRRVSVGSIAAAIAAPVGLWAFSYAAELIAMSILLAAVIILRHRDNIQRLLAGTEPHFGKANSR